MKQKKSHQNKPIPEITLSRFSIQHLFEKLCDIFPCDRSLERLEDKVGLKNNTLAKGFSSFFKHVGSSDISVFMILKTLSYSPHAKEIIKEMGDKGLGETFGKLKPIKFKASLYIALTDIYNEYNKKAPVSNRLAKSMLESNLVSIRKKRRVSQHSYQDNKKRKISLRKESNKNSKIQIQEIKQTPNASIVEPQDNETKLNIHFPFDPYLNPSNMDRVDPNPSYWINIDQNFHPIHHFDIKPNLVNPNSNFLYEQHLANNSFNFTQFPIKTEMYDDNNHSNFFKKEVLIQDPYVNPIGTIVKKESNQSENLKNFGIFGENESNKPLQTNHSEIQNDWDDEDSFWINLLEVF